MHSQEEHALQLELDVTPDIAQVTTCDLHHNFCRGDISMPLLIMNEVPMVFCMVSCFVMVGWPHWMLIVNDDDALEYGFFLWLNIIEYIILGAERYSTSELLRVYDH